jgi:hypothetical protein
MEINVKAGLVTTIANSVYSSALMKIRESLSNSIDSGASVCLFFLKSKDKGYAISIVDNGAGITTDRFGEIFKSIGYGLERTQVNTYSYFGLGLMSIFKLGKEVHIISKSKDGEIKKVRIESSNFFAEENENRSIQELQGFVTYSKSSMEEREEISCLSDESLFKIIGTSPNSFTEIVISDVYPEDVQEITSTGFVDEIRKFAPLKVNPSDQFFDNLDACDKAEVVELLSNDVYFPTIDYYFGTEYEDQIISLTKYFPNFDLGGKKFQKYICKVIDNEFAI